MRSKIFKKIMAVVCASAVLATSIASPVKTDAASKNAKAKKAYEKVVKKLNFSAKNYTTCTNVFIRTLLLKSQKYKTNAKIKAKMRLKNVFFIAHKKVS